MELAEEFRKSHEAADADGDSQEETLQRQSKRSLIICLNRKVIFCL